MCLQYPLFLTGSCIATFHGISAKVSAFSSWKARKASSYRTLHGRRLAPIGRITSLVIRYTPKMIQDCKPCDVLLYTFFCYFRFHRLQFFKKLGFVLLPDCVVLGQSKDWISWKWELHSISVELSVFDNVGCCLAGSLRC
jgi:hypothetical protein